MKQTQKKAGQQDQARKIPAQQGQGDQSSVQQEQTSGKNVQGEGNYEAARRYNDQTRKFAESGEVKDAARDAAPADESEARELDQAERAGRERAREEDPAIDRGRSLHDSNKH